MNKLVNNGRTSPVADPGHLRFGDMQKSVTDLRTRSGQNQPSGDPDLDPKVAVYCASKLKTGSGWRPLTRQIMSASGLSQNLAVSGKLRLRRNNCYVPKLKMHYFRAPWRISQQLAESPYSWIFGRHGVHTAYRKNNDFRENPGKEIFFWRACRAVPVISFGFWGVPVVYKTL